MLLEFPISNGKFDFFFFSLSSKNACNSYKESIALFYIAPKEPIWNNKFQQILARKPKRKNDLKLQRAYVNPVFMLFIWNLIGGEAKSQTNHRKNYSNFNEESKKSLSLWRRLLLSPCSLKVKNRLYILYK